ncbi:MAG: CRISPR-associated endonuclease Cas3'' [Ectothiorhodospiraceae bacterium]|nr:CRISPR-associated endonuclease Cas3'' [Ectothiorhodospiraceae bacterium]
MTERQGGFYAHSLADSDASCWHGLADHLYNTARRAADYAAPFSGQELAYAAGLLHDIGKYSAEFQSRLRGAVAKVDHSTWGARIACERYGPVGHLLAYGIAGHHAGLANGRQTEVRTALAERLNRELPELHPEWRREIKLPKGPLTPPADFRPHTKRGQFQLAFLARMVFSCLVDADFIDTESYFAEVLSRKLPRNLPSPNLTDLRVRLDTFLKQLPADTAVNRERGEILRVVRGKASKMPGLFSLTVPTGGGKTLASLAFALDHALAHDLRRIIYVIPFTSVVEQNAAVFRRAFGDLGDHAVLEHHSAFFDDRMKSPQSREKLKLAMENWDAPVVVTTAVQFFESLFADRPSRCRKLHNIARSVVILDEAQTFPLKVLRPSVAVIEELARNYGNSIVLCTATQPALEAPHFVDGLEDVRELAPCPERLNRVLKRVDVCHVGRLDDDALARYLMEHGQVLCIVNNRRHARSLYEAIAEAPGACHLTTLMCAKHRSQVLARVRQRLAAGEPCRLVATSLIEAGVDVDFPIVLRAEAGLDSIAQAAGRCNREGRRPPECSKVLIFAVDNADWAPPPELRQFAEAAREVLRQHPDDPMSLAAIQRYFRLLYWRKGSNELDAYDLLGRVEEGRLEGIPFETLATEFRMIESSQYPVIIPLKGDKVVQAALRDLEFAESCGGIARRLQPYTVQVPQRAYQRLRNADAIQPVASQQFGEQFMCLVNPDLYDDRFGLHWDDPDFMRAERLLW